MSNKAYFTSLIDKYISGSLTAEENETLRQMLDADENQPELERILLESFQHSGDERFWSDKYRQSFVDKLTQKISNEKTPVVRTAHRVHFIRRWWWAAAILLIGTTLTFIVVTDQQKLTSETVSSVNTSTEAILPGRDRAVLTLADGSTIALDSASAGQLAHQGNASVIKLANGDIRYDLKGISQGEVMLNTMSTPRGGQYRLILPDGSKVWLNAASSVTYPAVFIGKDRKIKITGEVFLEVAKNKEKPFSVDVDGKSVIEVLGTSFNVNSYADEEKIKTTLLDGSIKVNKSVVLKPGQQAQINTTAAASPADRQLKVVDADVAQALAWKDGIFDFTGADLKSVMKQLERWYDIKVQYKGNISNMTFDGRMYRNVELSDVLQVLQKMGVKFELDGKNLIVF